MLDFKISAFLHLSGQKQYLENSLGTFPWWSQTPDWETLKGLRINSEFNQSISSQKITVCRSRRFMFSNPIAP